jgi:hypothetical protein
MLLGYIKEKHNMKIKNSWRSPNKQWDKIQINVRLGAVTIFNLDIDWSSKKFSLSIMNFKLSNV